MKGIDELAALKVSVMRVGKSVVFMIEAYPTAYMLAVSVDEAEKIARGIDKLLAGKTADEYAQDLS